MEMLLLATLILTVAHIFPIQALLFRNCRDVSKVTCTIYNRNHPNGLTLAEGTFIPNQRIYVLVHGWLSNSSLEFVVKTRPSLLKMYPNVNVVVPDYGAYSRDPLYVRTLCSSPHVGVAIAEKFIAVGLHKNLTLIRCTGPSIGGQVCGAFARHFIEKGFGKIARITAIDLAGPGYDQLNTIMTIPIPKPLLLKSLCKDDAQKVVGIYSDASGGEFGVNLIPGYSHISIWLNGGRHQPCYTKCKLAGGSPMDCDFCSHPYSQKIYWHAVEGSKVYEVTKCDYGFFFYLLSNFFYLLGQCEGNPKFIYTEEIPDTVENGVYIIRTDADFNQIPYNSVYNEY